MRTSPHSPVTPRGELERPSVGTAGKGGASGNGKQMSLQEAQGEGNVGMEERHV